MFKLHSNARMEEYDEKNMMRRLEEANNKSARAVKLADICDNVNSCHTIYG